MDFANRPTIAVKNNLYMRWNHNLNLYDVVNDMFRKVLFSTNLNLGMQYYYNDIKVVGLNCKLKLELWYIYISYKIKNLRLYRYYDSFILSYLFHLSFVFY